MDIHIDDHHISDLTNINSAFGSRVIERLESIREDVEYAGTQGLMSLITAVIVQYSLTRPKLLSYSRQFCPKSHFGVLRELLDLFEGRDPKRHLWKVQDDGTYALLEYLL
jgi:hypothetical protein